MSRELTHVPEAALRQAAADDLETRVALGGPAGVAAASRNQLLQAFAACRGAGPTRNLLRQHPRPIATAHVSDDQLRLFLSQNVYVAKTGGLQGDPRTGSRPELVAALAKAFRGYPAGERAFIRQFPTPAAKPASATAKPSRTVTTKQPPAPQSRAQRALAIAKPVKAGSATIAVSLERRTEIDALFASAAKPTSSPPPTESRAQRAMRLSGMKQADAPTPAASPDSPAGRQAKEGSRADRAFALAGMPRR